MDQIIKVLEKSLFEYKPVKLIFSNPRKKSLPYRKVTERPVIIQCQMMYQAEYQYEKKVIQDNLSAAEVIGTLADLVERDFRQVNIFTEEEDIQKRFPIVREYLTKEEMIMIAKETGIPVYTLDPLVTGVLEKGEYER